MSRDPGDGPDEDGEQDDQPSDRTETVGSDADSPQNGDATNGPEEDETEAEPNTEDTESDVTSEADPSEESEDVESEESEEADKTVADDESEDKGSLEAARASEENYAVGDAEEEGEAEEESEDEGEDDEEADAEDEEAAVEGDEEEDAEDGEEGDGEDDEEGEVSEEGEGDEEDVEDGEGDEEGEEEDWKEGQTAIDRKTGPAEDEEQPLTEHIEEMVKRVAVVLFIAGIVSLLAFPFGEEFINFLWYSVLPSDISKPHVYHPLELIITQLKAASLLGVVLALPVFVYQTYAFMRPGLYPHERRYYLAAVPTSLVLAFVGLLFGYFLILPAVMSYFMQYSRDVVDIAFALGDTFTLMLVLLGFLAVVFQIPLFIMLAIMMGLTTRTWLEKRRLIMWGVFLGIAFLFSPDPTGMAPFLIALTMVGLYEGTLLLLRWTGRGG